MRDGTTLDLAPFLNGIAGIAFCVIPLDIVSGKVAGHLLNPRVLAFLIGALLAGKVHAVVAWPPCETWSKVRERAMANGQTTVLRTALTPWSIDGLRPKHLDQLFDSIELLLAALMLIADLLI